MKPKYLLLLLIPLLVFSSCQRYYYRANAVNAPLLTQKNDVHVCIAGFQTKNEEERSSVLDAQAAYSPIKHLGLIASYSMIDYKRVNEVHAIGLESARAYMYEFGAGYYQTFGPAKWKLVADLYAGTGFGKINSDVNMSGTRLFIQPGFGLRNKFVDASFNIRFCGISYSNFDQLDRTDGYLMEKKLINSDGTRIDNGSYWFWEPTLTIRAGYKFIKLQAQGIYTRPMSSPEWNYSKGRVTLGLYCNVEDIFRNKNTEKRKGPQGTPRF